MPQLFRYTAQSEFPRRAELNCSTMWGGERGTHGHGTPGGERQRVAIARSPMARACTADEPVTATSTLRRLVRCSTADQPVRRPTWLPHRHLTTTGSPDDASRWRRVRSPVCAVSRPWPSCSLTSAAAGAEGQQDVPGRQETAGQGAGRRQIYRGDSLARCVQGVRGGPAHRIFGGWTRAVRGLDLCSRSHRDDRKLPQPGGVHGVDIERRTGDAPAAVAEDCKDRCETRVPS